jgi:hypothetical protein
MRNVHLAAQCPNCQGWWPIRYGGIGWYIDRGLTYKEQVFCIESCLKEYKERGDKGRGR